MNKLQKRRLKNKLSERKSEIIIMVIVVFVVLLSSGYALLQVALNVNGRAIIDDNACEYNISPNFEITASWMNGDRYYYEVNLTIVNNGNEDIEDWQIIIDGPSDIGVGWMNGDYTIDNGVITINPLSYNRVIQAGGTFSYSFNLNTVEDELNIDAIYFCECLIYGEGSGQSAELTALEISPSSGSIATGENLNLSLIKTPVYKKITPTWVSSDTSIATVNQSGVVTGVSPGQVTISATAEGITATATITVTRQVIVLTGLTVTPSSYKMTIGEVAPLQVSKTPSNAEASITWSSSDTSVATVTQNGVVTALSLGTATITASSGNISSTCQIRVVQPVSYESVELNLTKTYAWDNNFHFQIDITNVSESDVLVSSFKLDIPDTSTIALWSNGGYSIEGTNVFTAGSWRRENPLAAGETISITGSVSLPYGDSYENYPDVDFIDVELE